MPMIQIRSTQREGLIDITPQVQEVVSASKIMDGAVILQSLHTTAGLAINENADPDVKKDILKGLSIFDRNDYGHSEGNSPAHIKASLMGPSLNVIVKDSQLVLGTWQAIYFCEFDGPRDRTVLATLLENKK